MEDPHRLGFAAHQALPPALAANGPGAALFTRAQGAIPEIDERRKPVLQRGESEPIRVILQALDPTVASRPSTRLRVSQGGRGRRPAKNMLYSTSSRRRSVLELPRDPARSRNRSLEHARGARPDQEPNQRKPQLARVGHRTIVDEHFAGIEAADDLEQLAQLERVARTETRAMPERVALPGLTVLGRPRAPASSASSYSGPSNGGKSERDRERKPGRPKSAVRDRDRARPAPRRSDPRARPRTARNARGPMSRHAGTDRQASDD